MLYGLFSLLHARPVKSAADIDALTAFCLSRRCWPRACARFSPPPAGLPHMRFLDESARIFLFRVISAIARAERYRLSQCHDVYRGVHMEIYHCRHAISSVDEATFITTKRVLFYRAYSPPRAAADASFSAASVLKAGRLQDFVMVYHISLLIFLYHIEMRCYSTILSYL